MTPLSTGTRGASLFAGVLILLLNSAYLAAFASPSLFYFSNIVLHMALGLVLGVVLTVRLIRRRDTAGLPILLSSVVLGAGALSGVAIMIVGAAGRTRWLVPAHIGLTIAGGVPLLAMGAWIAARQARSRQRQALGAAYVVATLAFVAAFGMAMTHDSRAKARYRIDNPAVVPASMQEEGRGPHSPFFPSSADTNVRGIIPANFFMTSETCGRCHTDIYKEWQSSAHRFSSFNNQWYRKSIEYMQDVVGTQPSKWCAGCHDHAVFFNGRFDRPIKEQIDTPEAQAGLGCTSCHAITRVGSTMGQGDFEVEYPPMHDLAASDNPILRFVHDQLTYIDPKPHRETFLKPFHRDQTAEFCSSCHKVHLDVPVNAYRWFRGFNDYDNWQASGVSGQGARSFYYPAKSQKCADCHMQLVPSSDPAAKNGKVKSHRFAAANTALPFVNKDSVQLKAVQDFLRDGQISVDIFGLVRTQESTPPPDSGRPNQAATEPRLASTFAVGEESMNFGSAQNFVSATADVIAPLDKVEAPVRRGESVRVEVVVRTRKVGHFFPGGTVDAFDVWVELEAVDDKGRVLLHSGSVADGGKGPVEPGAHFYRSLLLDEHGNQINKRNAWSARSVAYVRLIPPGAADTIHYRLQIPEDAGDRIYLKAKVNYRKFAWWNTQWAFSGVRDPVQKNFSLSPSHDDGRWLFTGDTSKVSGQIKAIPDIPTTVMAESSASLRVLSRGAPLPSVEAVTNRSVRERWNDYGIGLLLQGDIRNAEAVFLKVTQMDPGYADGWVNVGRARIQEGNMSAAEMILRKALDVDPKLAKTHFFLGMALKSLGDYDQALTHLREAASQYPRDRVVVNQLGRVLFLKREYAAAVEEFHKVLEIDPEDLQAHYNLMLCYQGLGDSQKASRQQALYSRFKADESSQAITGPYRQLNPDDNNERQQIHEHRFAPRAAPTTGAVSSRAGGGH
ncbi:MAG: tetratricopeptide repeat protein [Acidobacteria bacterium]|nr:tetratricopeptide repeat protein [Acidobacteriota bacterium]MCA1649590.1 tetratricopeptide repeat protein [Acidobacteriota bacterium]